MSRPSVNAWKTRLPAVVIVPPPMPPPPGMRHRICCETGSQATSAPRPPGPSMGDGPIAGGAGRTGVGAGRTVPVIRPGCGSYFASAAYEKLLLVDVGIYTRPVAGLNDMGDQMCAPPTPG